MKQKIKARLVYILFIIIFIGFPLFLMGCAGAPSVTPHVIDTDIRECRQYEVVNSETGQVKKVKDWPISHCNGFWALPPEEARLWKEYFLKKKSGR